MPYMIQKDGEMWCVHKEKEDGTPGEKVKCHPSEGEAKEHLRALYANVEDLAAKWMDMYAVKAVGDWELDITAVPFLSRDSDGQWFDEDTDIKETAFKTPLVLYQHGIKKGGKALDDAPVVIGDAVPGTLRKEQDGWHFNSKLRHSEPRAKDVMDAARERRVAVSSDSITHLARLDIGGKLIGYEKNRPGRIAVWPLAGVSLWELGNGNFQPASRTATALPAIKAIYRKAGISFPDVDANGVFQAEEAKRRAKIEEIRTQSKIILKKTGVIT